VASLQETVLDWFAEDGWSLTGSDDGHTWVATVEGEHGRWMTIVQVFEDKRVFAFYSLLPVSPPGPRIPAVVEYVTRANAGLVTGNFEVDLDSGEVRYKTAIDFVDVPEAALSDGVVVRALVSDLAYTNVATADRYLPGLLSVVGGSSSPAEAIDAIEGADS
jgi:hypothetical protein